jgi:hypothetical protein
MITNDNYAHKTQPGNATASSLDIANYIRGIATDLERMSQEAGLEAVAACLRATVVEARRVRNDDRLLKLGVTPDRRLG